MAVRYFTCPNTPYEYFNGVIDLLPDLEFENGVACADVDEFEEAVYTRKLIITSGACKVYTPEEWDYENDESWKCPYTPGYDEEPEGEQIPEPVCVTTDEEYQLIEEQGETMGDIIVTDEFAENPHAHIQARQMKSSPQENLSELSLKELKALAKERGIKGWYRMSSAKLQEVLSD